MRASNVVNATGVWADRLRPGELHDDAEVPRIRPSRGTHITLRHEDLPLVGGGAIVPAGGGRSIFALPWLGRTLLGTTDNDYEGDLDGSHHVPPSEEDIAYLLDATNEYFGTALTARRPDRRLRRRAAAHHLRRPEEVRRHLAQGRAVRDVERDGDDHRRQADDVAADGEDDRRPARRARGARRAVPHARDPARRGGRRSPTCRASRASRRRPTPRWPGATGTPRTTCSRSRASAASWPRRSSRGCPTCSPRSPTRRAASRRARSATCCCAAPGWACSPAVICAPAARSWRRVGAALGGRAGLGSDSERDAQLAAWGAEARAEGVVGSA